MPKPLEFRAVVINKVSTTVDGGIRLTFDIDASQAESAAVLMLLHGEQKPVTLTVSPE